jgi:hypothetical protein
MTDEYRKGKVSASGCSVHVGEVTVSKNIFKNYTNRGADM